jgi:hypothetical protein
MAPDARGSSQLDTDADGYGNYCDQDLNNSGATNAQDNTVFKSLMGLAPGLSGIAP